MDRFALIGAAGYIAPRHMKAIRDTGNQLTCALDPHDSVGILDQYFPDADFFTEFERFDRHVDKLAGKEAIDYVSVCSPNYLHDAHVRWALRSGSDAICEKPLVLNPWNVDALEQFEQQSGKKVWTIQQLRLHPEVLKLHHTLNPQPPKPPNPPQPPKPFPKPSSNPPKLYKHKVSLTYITPRGTWYHYSWKGNISKSGGIATNIGIHFFDLLIWLFGDVVKSKVITIQEDKAKGELELRNADVEWFLSIDQNDLEGKGNVEKRKSDQTIKSNSYRSLVIDGHEIDLSSGFTDLHTKSYEEILAGRGFGISEARKAIELVHDIRQKSGL